MVRTTKSSLIAEWRRLDLLAANRGWRRREPTHEVPTRLLVRPCPCGRCKKALVAPLFYGQDASVDARSAAEVVKRWNAYDLFFDGYKVWRALSPRARKTCTPDHVAHVLDAMAKLLKEPV
jgi:hypothetical protein